MTLVWLRMLRMITMNQVDTPANKDNNNNHNSSSTVSSSSLTTSKLAFLNNLLGVYNYESDIARNATRQVWKWK
jgi:hypothetical protein